MLPRRSSGVQSRAQGEQRQVEVKGSGGVESIEALSRINGHRVGGVRRASNGDQRLGEIGKEAPVPVPRGIRQSGAGNRAANAQMIELPAHGVEATFDIPEALAVNKLSEGQG